jgi:hypothetical protein
METEEKISKIWEDWKNCSSYLRDKGLFDIVPKCIKFYEGEHWGKPTDRTKDLPRVTINQTEMITNSKIAGILSNAIKITFASDKYPDLAEKMTRFNNFIEKELNFDEICADVVEDGGIVGCAPCYVYWNEDLEDKHGNTKGSMVIEQIDMLNVGVHNPKELDIQRQKWVILKTRQEVDEVKKLLDDPSKEDMIQPDDEDKDTSLEYNKEQEGSRLCTVVTRFFRKNGEVYFEKATKNVLIHGARPLNPKLIKTKDEEGNEVESAVKYKATLYPIELYVYKKRKGCIYGRGEVEPIIMNNKAVNFSFSMMAKSIEDLGFGTVVAKESAIGKGERLSNDPTKILIDKYKGAGQGFYSLNKQAFSAQVPQAINSILETTRSVTGATEVMTGEVTGANQSGTSIAYLQQQAQRPLSKLVERYKRFRERMAEIFNMFYVLYYEDKEFTYEKEDEEVKQPQTVVPGMPVKQKPTMAFDTFNGREFEDIDFAITAQAGTGSQWSELTELNMLEMALTQGQIDFETFVKAYPTHLITNKKILLDGIEATKNGVLAQAQAMIQQLQGQVQAQQAQIQEMEGTIDKTSQVIKQNRELQKYFAELQNEYANKISVANAVNKEVTQDASEFAQHIYDTNRQNNT